MDQQESANSNEPDYLDFGQCELRAVNLLMEDLKISRNAVARLCKSLEIPLIHMGKRAYYNPATLQKAIHVLSRHGGPGFAFPGSCYMKNKTRFGSKVPTKITKAIVDKIADPALTLEMIAYTGRSRDAAEKFAGIKAVIEEKRYNHVNEG